MAVFLKKVSLDVSENPPINKIAFPLGGIGAGMICMDGNGAISHVSVNNKPDIFNEPYAYAAIMVKGVENGAKVLQSPVSYDKVFGRPNTGNGAAERSYGLPRFSSGEFLARFPFATLKLEDEDIPMQVEITGWSPFIPGDEDNSSLPAGFMEYHFKNNSGRVQESVFSWNSANFLKGSGTKSIESARNGFTLALKAIENESYQNSWFTASVDDNNAIVNHCWFRGGWWDSNTITWKNVSQGILSNNPPVKHDAPGASIFVPFTLKPGEEKTIRLQFCWFVPNTNLMYGQTPGSTGPAFGKAPAYGLGAGQGEAKNYVGLRFINTAFPLGDGQTGTLTSPEFLVDKNYLKFLVGGGDHKKETCVNLKQDDKILLSVTGRRDGKMEPVTWDLSKLKGKKLKIEIVDSVTGDWGHILADQFVLTDNPDESLVSPSSEALVLCDFESSDYGQWQTSNQNTECCLEGECENPFFQPWYASRFKSIDEVEKYMRLHYEEMKKKSETFRDAFYASTLPAEVIEAVAANLTILKSPTVLRQFDGRMWAWEGCNDLGGCCAGSCTHVWNYAQAIPHLFPALERSLRETEFNQSQNDEGHQVFRSGLPIKPIAHGFHAAADGQLGGIMKVYRDWRISGDNQWMEELYPKVKQSLDYCISVWDPKRKGFLEEPHHNTYDIEFWGPNGMCTSFYLGALTAMVEISKDLDKPYSEYEELMKKGKKFMENELFDGEYFIQKIQWEGLEATNPIEFSTGWNANYSQEARELLKEEGPKYQYGTGCLSDGILGMWIASVCGLPEIIDNEKVTSHLNSVHKYNLKKDLSDHANPQRPTYACGKEGGLLLCTWPKGGALSLPFVYSNEVWTGIEYQVASHLMFKGEVNKGLEIVQELRRRYDGKKRNPFNEYECGHWYARAMASYGLLEGLTGIRYDAVTKTLTIDSRIGDNFTSFLSTENGFGNVGLKDGKPFVDVKMGEIDVEHLVVSGEEIKM